MFRGKQFALAWTEIWMRRLSLRDPRLLHASGLEVGGLSYKLWLQQWKQDRRRLSASAYITMNADEIQGLARTTADCGICGYPGGLHAPGCVYADRELSALRFVHVALTQHRPAQLLYFRLGLADVLTDTPDEVINAVLARVDDSDRATVDATIASEDALADELKQLAASGAPSDKWTQAEFNAVRAHVAMLNCLITQAPGSYARLGEQLGLSWVQLLDKFQELSALSQSERDKMAACCNCIRPMAAFQATMQQLLSMEP